MPIFRSLCLHHHPVTPFDLCVQILYEKLRRKKGRKQAIEKKGWTKRKQRTKNKGRWKEGQMKEERTDRRHKTSARTNGNEPEKTKTQFFVSGSLQPTPAVCENVGCLHLALSISAPLLPLHRCAAVSRFSQRAEEVV